jgi:hypothetical protein
MLRKTLLTVFTRTMLGASIVAPIAVHAQLPLRVALLLSPAALLPVSLAVVLLVSLVPAVLLVLGPLAFLVLLPSEAGVLAFMVVRVRFTAATGPMPGSLRQLTVSVQGTS